MSITITPQSIITAAALIAAIVALIKYVTTAHDQMKKWDAYDAQIQEVKQSIEEVKTDYTAKIQEVKTEQCIQTYVLKAVLDGLHQLHCNGEVTEAMTKLDNYLNEQAHN